jgi:hypothetical protein
MKVCISNPPYNLKWQHPIFAQIQDRFKETVVPPQSNSNFAFILTALNECEKSCFILPNGILTGGTKEELEIKKYIIEKNYLEAVITCPNKMFEATSIPVCIMLFNKKKTTSKIVMIDATNFCKKEVREQRGQFGGESHEKRIYKKEINIFTEEQIEELYKIVKGQIEKDNFSKCITIEDMKNNDYNLSPNGYININFEEQKTRKYDDIVNDLNRVIKQKNCLKLTINETIAKSIGIDKVLENMKENQKCSEEMSKILQKLNLNIEKENFLSLSKNKNEIKFENNSKEQISEILMLIMNNWKVMIYHLNNEENRYLIELRDKLLPDLMDGKINLEDIVIEEGESNE